jgi:hypothetical protein
VTRGGVLPGRVAEIFSGTDRRGSGYLVAAGRVLTAHHVLSDGGEVHVRFPAGGSRTWCDAKVLWSDPVRDLAVLGFEPSVSAGAVDRVRIARLPADRPEIGVRVLGYPRWKLRRQDSTFRDLVDAAGSVATLANRVSGTLEITVAAGPADDPDMSPWGSMSGAPVFAGTALVGIVTEHHPREGLRRLTASRLDTALSDPVLARLLRAKLTAVPEPPAASVIRRRLILIAPIVILGASAPFVARFLIDTDHLPPVAGGSSTPYVSSSAGPVPPPTPPSPPASVTPAGTATPPGNNRPRSTPTARSTVVPATAGTTAAAVPAAEKYVTVRDSGTNSYTGVDVDPEHFSTTNGVNSWQEFKVRGNQIYIENARLFGTLASSSLEDCRSGSGFSSSGDYYNGSTLAEGPYCVWTNGRTAANAENDEKGPDLICVIGLAGLTWTSDAKEQFARFDLSRKCEPR